MNTLGIFAKSPQPGRVKTRLGEVLGHEAAAQLYAAFLRDLLDRFATVADRRIVGYSPGTPDVEAEFHELGGRNYGLWPQPPGGLGKRMQQFFSEALVESAGPVVLIGSDSPTLPTQYVQRAFEELAEVDCVIGPATDGGYYLIGMRRLIADVFDKINWSGADVLAQTIRRLRDSRCSMRLLPVWYDVDTVEDLAFLRGHLLGLSASGSPGLACQTAEWLESHTHDDVRLV